MERRLDKMSAAELATAVAAAERAAPAFLAAAQDASALSDVLLPVLTQPWSARSLEMARKAENAPAQNAQADTLMSGVQLPLHSDMDVIQCDNCKRMLLRESMDKHKVCAAAAASAKCCCALHAPPCPLPRVLSSFFYEFPSLSSLIRRHASRCPSPRFWRRTRPSRCPRARTTSRLRAT